MLRFRHPKPHLIGQADDLRPRKRKSKPHPPVGGRLEVPGPAWLNRKYWQQAGMGYNCPSHVVYAGLAGFQGPAHSKKVLELECSNRSPGSVKLPGPEQTHGYAPVPQATRGPSWWPQTLCWPFIPGTGSVLPHPRCLPFKERSAGSAASTHSNFPADSKNPKEENHRSALAISAFIVFAFLNPSLQGLSLLSPSNTMKIPLSPKCLVTNSVWTIKGFQY